MGPGDVVRDSGAPVQLMRGEVVATAEGSKVERRPIGPPAEGLGYPVVDDAGRYFALRYSGRELVLARLSSDETAWEDVASVGDLRDVRLLGVRNGQALAVATPFAFVTIALNGGAVTRFAATDSDAQRTVAAFLGDTASSVRDESVSVGRSTSGGRGWDVFFKNANGQSVNISDVGNNVAGQATLAGPGIVLYAQATR